MKSHFNKFKNEYISIGVLMSATGALVVWLLQLWRLTLSVPMEYYGSDEMSALVNAKLLTSQTWLLSNDRLGAPYGSEFYDFPANLMHNVDNLILKLFAVITGNVGASVNLLYFSTFFMIALISYLVMRELKITNWVAVCGSLVFTFMPYIFMRSILHIVLTSYYFVPLSLLLCFWIYERDDILVFNRNFFKNKRNLFIILFVILIANNGIAYYPFFTCFLLMLTGVSKAVKTNTFRPLLKSISVVVGISVFLVADMIPSFLYNLQNGKNTAAVVREGISKCEEYGLKIIQLFLPVNHHGVGLFQKAIDTYNGNSYYVNENTSSYLGLIGICGFFILILTLFAKKDNLRCNGRIRLLAEMNIGMVLFGIVGGFSAMFAVLISNEIRAYNRISIFIAYVCILAVAFMVDSLYKKQSKKNNRTILVVLGIVATLFCIWEQFPKDCAVPNYEANYINYYSDAAFVAKIEEISDEGARIFQLPYHAFPEGPAANEMGDYHLFIGYIHSDKLRWSYGAIKGRDGSEWSKFAASQPTYEDMIEYIEKADFTGIYIDRRAYKKAELAELEGGLAEILGAEPMVSDNENLSFFSLKEVSNQ